MSERKLVSIRDIKSLTPIEGADHIEVAEVDGWKVIVNKGEFVQGVEAIYFEIDSALPLDRPEFAFLADRGSETIGDKQYHVLKTEEIHGVYSQGLLLSSKQGFERDADLSEEFGVFKYEPPLSSGS